MRIKNVCPSICFRYMNVREVALWPQARRKRADNETDNIEVSTAFRQITAELKKLCTKEGRVQVYNAATS